MPHGLWVPLGTKKQRWCHLPFSKSLLHPRPSSTMCAVTLSLCLEGSCTCFLKFLKNSIYLLLLEYSCFTMLCSFLPYSCTWFNALGHCFEILSNREPGPLYVHFAPELFPLLSGHIADSSHILLAVRCGPVTKCNWGNLRATSCLVHRNLQWMILWTCMHVVPAVPKNSGTWTSWALTAMIGQHLNCSRESTSSCQQRLSGKGGYWWQHWAVFLGLP